jgi:hypothetical protein
VPFPIVGFYFLRFFGMQVNPSSPAILIAPSQRFQEGGTAGGEDSISSHVCYSAQKEAQVPQLIAAAGARPVHPRIMKMLQEEFPQLLRPSSAAPQPTHGVVHHILTEVGQYLPKLAAWSQPSAASPRRNSPPWKRQV